MIHKNVTHPFFVELSAHAAQSGWNSSLLAKVEVRGCEVVAAVRGNTAEAISTVAGNAVECRQRDINFLLVRHRRGIGFQCRSYLLFLDTRSGESWANCQAFRIDNPCWYERIEGGLR